jgi:hypothetical protein
VDDTDDDAHLHLHTASSHTAQRGFMWMTPMMMLTFIIMLQAATAQRDDRFSQHSTVQAGMGWD